MTVDPQILTMVVSVLMLLIVVAGGVAKLSRQVGEGIQQQLHLITRLGYVEGELTQVRKEVSSISVLQARMIDGKERMDGLEARIRELEKRK